MAFGSSDREVGIDVVAHDMASSELARVSSGLSGVTNSAGSAQKATGGFHGTFTSLIQGAAMGVGMAAFQAVSSGVMGVAQAMIGGASENEKYEVQLGVLLGSVGAAKARYAELVEFAKKTPFEIPEVVRASKTLQVFGGDALATGDNLTLVGDIAAGTGMQFDEVSMWIGRMYDAMKSGRPFGEAAMRLQEMGAMSGDSRAKLEKLAAGVKDGSVTMETAWGGAKDAFGRFGGMMEKQAETMEGKLSNLSDAVHQGLAKIGEKMLPLLKGAVDIAISALTGLFDALDHIGDSPVGDVIKGISDSLGTLAGVIGPVVTALSGPFATFLGFMGDVVGYIIGPFVSGITAVMDVLGWLGDRVNDLSGETQRKLDETVAAEAASIVEFKANILNGDFGTAAKDAAAPIPEEFGKAGDLAVAAVTKTMGDVASEIQKGRQAIVDAMQNVIDGTYDPLITAGELAAVDAELNSKDLRDALKSKDPEIVADAKLKRLNLLKEHDELSAELLKWGDATARMTGLKGEATSAALIKGLKSKDEEQKLWSLNAAKNIASEIASLDLKSTTWGTKTGNAYIDGLVTSLESEWNENRLRRALGKVAGPLEANSPPGPESPLHLIDKWGERTTESWIEGMVRGAEGGLGAIQGSLSRVAGALQAPVLSTAPALMQGVNGGSGPVTVNVAAGAFVAQGVQNPEQFARDSLLALRRELSRQRMSLA